MGCEEVMRHRDNILSRLEDWDRALRRDGSVQRWFAGADDATRAVSDGVNGPLLAELLVITSYGDLGAADLFRNGAPLLGKLPHAGSGPAKAFPEPISAETLWASSSEHNREIVSSLREDANSAALHDGARADAALSRMTAPVLLADADLSKVRLSPRFSIIQGVKEDGAPKIRVVDDESRGGVNAACQPVERLQLDGADVLVDAIRYFRDRHGHAPALFKADVDSAYRRIPIAPEHRWAAYSTYVHDGNTWVTGHLAMMFGALAAVFGWDRVGAALAHLARKLLRIATLRYVDDFFGPCAPAAKEHTMASLARLVRVLLGPRAISDRKLECGDALEILGLHVSFSVSGIHLFPAPKKVRKWVFLIRQALDDGKLCAGQASKLAGALSWAGQRCFERLGRAMLQPLFSQQHSRRGEVRGPLALALSWWADVLDLRVHQAKPWTRSERPEAHLFADARGGSAPRLAAVLFIDGLAFWTDAPPDDGLLTDLAPRSDSQIMALELLAIALGLATFGERLANRRVVIWSDNVGAEAAVRSGRASAWDHSRIIHSLWYLIARIGCGAWFDRVPSEENVADLPSREKYELLRLLEANFVTPQLSAAEFFAPSTFLARTLSASVRRKWQGAGRARWRAGHGVKRGTKFDCGPR